MCNPAKEIVQKTSGQTLQKNDGKIAANAVKEIVALIYITIQSPGRKKNEQPTEKSATHEDVASPKILQHAKTDNQHNMVKKNYESIIKTIVKNKASIQLHIQSQSVNK